MTDKMLTDNEIKKALEICSTYKASCKDCPAFVKVDRSNCKQVFLGAIEIINRLQVDLIDKEKQLQEALKSMAVNKTKVIDCEKEINRQKAEIDDLKRNDLPRCKDALRRANEMGTALEKENQELKAENERLKPFEDKIAEFNSHIRVEDMLVFASSLEEWLEFCENLKAEAYKEFAERLLLCCEDFDEINEVILLENLVKAIDDLLKEMVGD